jgi:hypothetical protein
VVVSHHASLSERKPAPACFTASRTFNRSRVERGQAIEPGHNQHVPGLETV